MADKHIWLKEIRHVTSMSTVVRVAAPLLAAALQPELLKGLARQAGLFAKYYISFLIYVNAL